MKDYYVLMQTDINEPAKVSEKVFQIPSTFFDFAKLIG